MKISFCSMRVAVAVAMGFVLSATGCGPETRSEGYRDVSSVPVEPKRPAVLTRLVFQDYETKSLRWVDVLDSTPPSLGPTGSIDGFPKLDPKRQQLVQMESAGGLLFAGVREEGDDRRENGWVLVDPGVGEESHGDHADWQYEAAPRVLARQLDAKQGNPAHCYQYDNVFYLANDENSGYTRLDPARVARTADDATIRGEAGFHQGGGHHITLAVAGGRVGYSAWIDGGGPNKGRVDVTAIRPAGNTSIAYSFVLPTGGIHGATVCQGKVFFAPSDGLCWVAADPHLKAAPTSADIHHISLGTDDASEKPLRTGAFSTFGKHVLFVSGAGTNAAMCVLDASAESPSVTRVALEMKAGNRPVTPEVIETRNGKRYAFVFHDHPQDIDAENRLTVIDLDPDGNGDFTDACAARSLEVGSSRLDGHYGHHSIAFDADGRAAFFTNPGDGTLGILDLKTLEVAATIPVGGVPTKVVSLGGREEHH